MSKVDNLLKNCILDYGLSDLTPCAHSTYHDVFIGMQQNQAIVLKLSMDVHAIKQEAQALRAFSEHGVVNVLAEKNGALLMERVLPGISLKTYFPKRENDALAIASSCIKKLHRAIIPKNHTFPTIQDWLKSLDEDINIPYDFLKKARNLSDKLLATCSKPVLLHGDLHHDNILQNGKDWVLIDPKGVIGETAYELGAFMRNPFVEILASENFEGLIQHRIQVFSSNFNISSQRILEWSFVQAVLAWIWAIEDDMDTHYWEKMVGLLSTLLPDHL